MANDAMREYNLDSSHVDRRRFYSRSEQRSNYRTSFQPPDDVILKQIKARVQDVPDLDASDDLSIDVKNGVVTFTGFVDNDFAKMVAYDVAKVHGVRQVWNDLVVRNW